MADGDNMAAAKTVARVRAALRTVEIGFMVGLQVK